MEPADYLTSQVTRLLGEVRGKRTLELGMAGECLSLKLIAQGASPLLVEESAEKLTSLRNSEEFGESKFEIRRSQLADLAFCPAESIDIAFSVIALTGTGELARVFRQLQRVLKDQGILVFGLIHPLAFITHSPTEPIKYRSGKLIDRDEMGFPFPVPLPEKIRPISFGEAFSELKRAGFGVDQLLEIPDAPPNAADDPTTLLIRAKK